MRILLAGGTGVLGRRLSRRLVTEGHEVAATTRRPERAPALAALGVTPLVLDVFDVNSVSKAFEQHRPDVVLHQLTDLSEGDVEANASLRARGTWSLVDAATKVGVERMIAQSISWAYVPGPGPADESVGLDLSAPHPRAVTVEGVGRLESAVAELAGGVVLRYGTLYGPGTWYGRGGRISRQVLGGKLPATADITCFLHVADAVQAAVDALDWPPGAVNVVDDEPAPGTEWLPAFARALGAPAPPVGGEPGGRSRAVSNRRARSLGWLPAHPTWRTGLPASLHEAC
ncbi:NAD-dependent epimerase/dehydratase family protein [Microlunatus flavus]|uniref:Nucleoside-diphosphate-sugar epimerase n=1 Tax=Microlunatus flavus TaxID=1036181 RepID=A0A1H9JKQ2_9ACTN|nr:NAD(P)-dependent oxidoreductase [Microlunatus flavus]SEQ87462.1 Nucleoside-diphosphate-sugar epimerase [Microlunatus flavus]